MVFQNEESSFRLTALTLECDLCSLALDFRSAFCWVGEKLSKLLEAGPGIGPLSVSGYSTQSLARVNTMHLAHIGSPT